MLRQIGICSQVIRHAERRQTVRVAKVSVDGACRQQKKGKSAGPDGLHMEAFVFGCSRLYVHLSVLFNLFLSHCHLPNEFMQSVVVPLVKSKTGNMNDANNYLSNLLWFNWSNLVALSNAVSKILESIFLQHVKSNSDVDMYQFGFKAGHSTGQCTESAEECCQVLCRQWYSHVFVCFLDFSKVSIKLITGISLTNFWMITLLLIWSQSLPIGTAISRCMFVGSW